MDLNARYWSSIRLDFTDVNLTGYRLSIAELHGATFTGDVRFDEATFTGGARFIGARGLKAAGLEEVRPAPVPAGVERLWSDD